MGVIIQDTSVIHSSSTSSGYLSLPSCENSGFNRKLVMAALHSKNGSYSGTPDFIFDYGGSDIILTNILNIVIHPYSPVYYRLTLGYLDNPPAGSYITRVDWGSSGNAGAFCWSLSNAKEGIDITADSETGDNSVSLILGAGEIGDLILTACTAINWEVEILYDPVIISGISGVTGQSSYSGDYGNGAYGYEYYPNKGTESLGWGTTGPSYPEFTKTLMGAVGIKAAAIGRHGMHP